MNGRLFLKKHLGFLILFLKRISYKKAFNYRNGLYKERMLIGSTNFSGDETMKMKKLKLDNLLHLLSFLFGK